VTFVNSEIVQRCFFPVLWAFLLLDASLVCGAFLVEFGGEFRASRGLTKAMRALRRWFSALLQQVFVPAAEGKIRLSAVGRSRWS
jgi:hypothetical protein